MQPVMPDGSSEWHHQSALLSTEPESSYSPTIPTTVSVKDFLYADSLLFNFSYIMIGHIFFQSLHSLVYHTYSFKKYHTNLILLLSRVLNILFAFERSMRFFQALQFCDLKKRFLKDYIRSLYFL